MIDPLIVALQDAARAGFIVQIGPTVPARSGYFASVSRRWVIAGEATDRLEPFKVERPDLTDALGNALAIVGVEIGIDRAKKERALTNG